MSNYKNFVNKCIKNRLILEFSEKEMASYLIGVTENDYINFEHGKYLMSEDNLKRIIRVLCVKNIKSFNLSDYIETEGLSNEEMADLSVIVSEIVGDDNA